MRAAIAGVVLVVLGGAAACEGSDPSSLAGVGGAMWSGGGEPTTGGAGGASSTTSVGGGGGRGGDLGWPFPDDVPTRCEAQAPDGGAAWDGWANLQFPSTVSLEVGATSAPIYGRVYRQGETDGAGQASGWEAELAVGPRGTLPTGEGRCWSFLPASFNVDVGNDDEYQATFAPSAVGLRSAYYRYRPPGGAWRYGDLDGSDDGVELDAASVVDVTGEPEGPMVVVSLNLRCRLDDWAARRPLVVEALARVDPDLVAFQEDCVNGGGPSQAQEIRAELATYTGRGYALRRAVTHQAESGGDTYEEGISLLSAWPLEGERVLDLPFAQIPRKALAVDVAVGAASLRFYATHLDFGAAGESSRAEAAAALVADLPSGLAVVAGDLNADPQEPAIATLNAALTDGWTTANPSQVGSTFPSDDPATRIDYVFASPGPAVVGATLLDTSSAGTWLSDHLGVAVALELR